MDRRDFLLGAATAMASVGLGGVGCFGREGDVAEGRVEPDREGFGALVGETFRILDAEGHATRAELVRVEDGPARADRDEYTLVFRSDRRDYLEPKLYAFYHTRVREFLAYLEPLRDDARGRLYAIVFNQFRPGAPAA